MPAVDAVGQPGKSAQRALYTRALFAEWGGFTQGSGRASWDSNICAIRQYLVTFSPVSCSGLTAREVGVARYRNGEGTLRAWWCTLMTDSHIVTLGDHTRRGYASFSKPPIFCSYSLTPRF